MNAAIHTALLTSVSATTVLLACSCARSSAPGGRDDAPLVWQKRSELASGEAVRGPWLMNESDFRWVDDPSVDLSASGEAAVVWVDQSRKDVFFRRYAASGAALGPAVNVSRSPAIFSWLPRVLVGGPDGGGDVHVLWQEIVFSGGSHGGEIFFARSTDGGRTFTEPVNISNSPAGDGKGRLDRATWDNGSLDLARAPRGALYAAWTEYEGALWIRRSQDGGSTFLPAVRVAGADDAPARAPSLAVRDDRSFVAWSSGERPRARIELATSHDGTTFSAVPVPACEGHCDAPRIGVDGEGTLHLAYAESGRGRTGYEVRYARLRRDAAEFEPARLLSRTPHDDSDAFPRIAVDSQRRVYVLWERFRGTRPRPDRLVLAVSTDGGERFAVADVPSIAGPELGASGSQQGMLGQKLATNDSGSFVIVNSTFDLGRVSQVWMLRGRAR